MLGDFNSAEFQELADDLFEDGIDVVLVRTTKTAYDPATLRSTVEEATVPGIKLIWTTPQQSTQMQYDSEVMDENYTEHKVASILYRGDIATRDTMDVPGFGKFIVTGIIRVAPLGPTIYHRIKLSR